MSLKLKALGLGLLAMMAISAFGAVNAGAEAGGHFTSDSLTGKTNITVTENTPIKDNTHFLELTVPGLTGIVCHEPKYEGTLASNTVESITIIPSYKKCKTTGSATENEITVHVNGCTYTFTVNKSPETKHQTVHLICPPGQSIKITHPSCEITVAPQTVTSGVLYKTDVQNGKHAITLESTSTFTATFHAGACVLLGTNKVSNLTGSATVEGFQDNGIGQPHGPAVNITAT